MQETHGRSPRIGNGNPIQYSCLENSMDSGAWQATVNGAAELDTTERLREYVSMPTHTPNTQTYGSAWHLHLTVSKFWRQLSRPFNFIFLCISIISSFSCSLPLPPLSLSLSPMHHFSHTLYSSVALKSVELINITQVALIWRPHSQNGSSKGCLTYAHRVVQEMHSPLCAAFHGFSFLLLLLSYRYFYLH